MHSTTKALNGHADLFGGALLAADPALVEKLQWWANAAGLSGSAYDSAQILRGLRTLVLRVDRQEASARTIADWLSRHARAIEIHYPRIGFMISFRVAGGTDAAAKFLKGLELITLASSLGGFATLICKPATMTHRGMPPGAQAEAGIHPDLLRLSVGLEDAEDLVADLERGFGAIN
jgi:cystathionine gamma-synthase